MNRLLIYIVLFFGVTAYAEDETNDLVLEFYLDSLTTSYDIDYQVAVAEFLTYTKKNYKAAKCTKDFLEYTTQKIKDKQKEYTKNFTKELHEFHSFAIMAHKNLHNLEHKIYSIILDNKPDQSADFIEASYLLSHQTNYWELNCYKPYQLSAQLTTLYSKTENIDLVDKLSLFFLAAKIYKASYYVNPMHICESKAAKIEILYSVDSLNINTKSITIDSIPTNTKPPKFVGGYSSLNNYIHSNLRYPEKAIVGGEQGIVLVSFKVDEAGFVYDARIKNSPSEYLSKEAIRIINSFPRWFPDSNTQKGAGFTKFTMPVEFVLPEK